MINGRLREAGHICRKVITQAYDPVKNLFLPDRFIRGSCPHCSAPEQYGDSCENCSRTYSPSDLVDPVSALSGATPEQRESEHLFFKLSNFEDMLKVWLVNNDLQAGVVNKLNEWFDAGLRDWDISRDDPYFGFQIPNESGKYFYVESMGGGVWLLDFDNDGDLDIYFTQGAPLPGWEKNIILENNPFIFNESKPTFL